STVRIEPHVADVTHGNILEFIVGADLILDGTDNFEIRFLINDAAVETGTPWVHAGCVGSQGQTMTVRPGITPCFRCLMPEAPGPGTGDTCDTAGVIGPAVQIMASLQVIDALKILSGQPELIPPRLTIVDVWTGSFRHLNLETLSRKNCSCCGGSERLWLSGEKGSQSTVLCGRNSVQIAPVSSTALSFDTIARRLQSQGTVRVNPFLLTFRPMEMETTIPQADSHQSHSQLELTLFRDGRAIISGTEDLIAAKAFYVRFIGT
ncbi:MAG TPA: ThiF family adenylyltransferase, partial [Planctomicrobium sp.]|nr:ThiF family adenylyltransferase [Planctomicrobium sp.]